MKSFEEIKRDKKVEALELFPITATNNFEMKPGVPAKILKEKCSNVKERRIEHSKPQECESEAVVTVDGESNRQSQAIKRLHDLSQTQVDRLLSQDNSDTNKLTLVLHVPRHKESNCTATQTSADVGETQGSKLAKRRKEGEAKSIINDDANVFEFIRTTLEKNETENLPTSTVTLNNKPDEMSAPAPDSTSINDIPGLNLPSTSKAKFAPIQLLTDSQSRTENSANQPENAYATCGNRTPQETSRCQLNVSRQFPDNRVKCAQPIDNQLHPTPNVNLGSQTIPPGDSSPSSSGASTHDWWSNEDFPKETRQRLRWSKEAKLLVYGTFRNFIEQRKGPGLKKCQDLIIESPLLLDSRTPAQVNSLISNWIHGKSPQPVDIGSEKRAVNSSDDDDCGKRFEKRRWSREAKQAVCETFRDCIDQKTVPGLDKCQELINAQPLLFYDRTPTQVNCLVSNWILGKTEMPGTDDGRFVSKYFPKGRWSEEAKRLVAEEFSDCIKLGAAPGLERCRRLMEQNPEEFVGRRPVQINLLVDNWLRGKAKPPGNFEHLFARK